MSSSDDDDDHHHHGKKARRGGRPPFEPNDTLRRQVLILAGQGNPNEPIAEVIGISEPTLRKYFQPELKRGRMLGLTQNTKRLHDAAAKGNVTAMIWLDKTRYGVREPNDVGKKQIVNEVACVADRGTKWDGLLQ